MGRGTAAGRGQPVLLSPSSDVQADLHSTFFSCRIKTVQAASSVSTALTLKVDWLGLVASPGLMRRCANIGVPRGSTMPGITSTVSAKRDLTGMSAGEIAHAGFAMGDPVLDSIVEAAVVVQESIRSPWFFVERWPDGTTVWREPEGKALAVVSSGGEIREEPLGRRRGQPN